ncbi:hypothetical protein IAU60_001017 [Kwoniella sp. DSM 27419]
MSFSSYQEGIRQATDLANRAIQTESSLSTLAPLASPLPTLQRAFPIYISAAETYSHLIASGLVPAVESSNVRKKWRLVLERAEKIKARIEALGGQVGRVEVGDQGEEAAVIRRGGHINGVDIPLWTEPTPRLFEGEPFVDPSQPELAEEQTCQVPIWSEQPAESWKVGTDERWVLQQGPVSDCSVVAAMGVELEHNRQFGTRMAWNNLYPKAVDDTPKRSDNGKHVLKLLLNGAWRSVIFDALLPHASSSGTPLYTTCHPATAPATTGAPWAPLALKGYFKAFGGYSLRGSNPAPDIYAFTGWIPERLSLREGFQREKEWKRILSAWRRGEVMVSLGTGARVCEGLTKLHAYGVVGLREEGHERLLDVFDPGATVLTMSWDRVCSEFEALHLNWKPDLLPVVATRHWSWSKPSPSATVDQPGPSRDPQFRLRVTCPQTGPREIWILLSQHVTSKDRLLDDVALHVFEEHGVSTKRELIRPERADQASPYANSMHVLVRYAVRGGDTTLRVIPTRDRGMFQTGFTLQALAPTGATVALERDSQTLPFSQLLTGSLHSRNAGGHPGWPSHMINPQYALSVRATPRGEPCSVRMMLHGDKDLAWNVKLLWGRGELVSEVSEDMVVADTGSYTFGMAFLDRRDVRPGNYTLIVSAFEPGQMGPFTLAVESTLPVEVTPLPAEGAGMFSRVVAGRWTEDNAGGRPSGGAYHRNPKIEVILPKPGTLLSRLLLPAPSPTPINLTVFRRAAGGGLGEQVATTGPYSDALSGVATGRVKLDQGIYILIPSSFEPSKADWTLKVWSDVAISVEMVTL